LPATPFELLATDCAAYFARFGAVRWGAESLALVAMASLVFLAGIVAARGHGIFLFGWW
jgi:hypothetical protein